MSEADLQNQICRLLDRLGIVYFRSRMDKRATNKPGTPDFIFGIIPPMYRALPQPVAWEVKLPNKKLSPEQEKMREQMNFLPNFWNYAVITSIEEAESELKAMGILS